MTFCVRNLLTSLTGYWMALLSGDCLARLPRDIFTVFLGHWMAFLPWHFSWHLGTVFFWHIVALLFRGWFTLLMRNLGTGWRATGFTNLSWDFFTSVAWKGRINLG